MSIYIKKLQHWFNAHPKAKEWGWFIILWLGGLITVLLAAYPFKWLIKRLG